MPCFSASNVRFISAETQLKQKCQELKARAQTAAYKPPVGGYRTTASSHLSYVPFQRRCEQYQAFDQKQLRRNERERKRKQGTKEVVLKDTDLQRIKNQCKIMTVNERLQEIHQREAEHQRQLDIIEKTRQHFKKYDDARMLEAGESKTKSLDQELHDDKMSVLNRAFLARHEQEEEVKQVNRMLLDAKCKAVREAQIQEKQQMERALRNDDERLAKMVNERAKEALLKADERERQEAERRNKFAQEIRKQLSERETLRSLEAQRVAEEAKDLHKATQLLQEEEQRQREFLRMRKRSFHEEIQRLRQMSNVFKDMLCEQERLADLRIVAYMREKREKERQLKEMQMLAKKQFERRQQHIYKLAATAKETREAKDELMFLKERDRLEREYRQKEKEAAIRKRETERDLLEARTKQDQDLKKRLALEIAHAEEEFNKVMERLRKEEEKQKSMDRERECRRQSYRRELRQQMTDKEQESRRLAEIERQRVSEWLEEQKQRESNIKQVIESKIAAMRENCLPDKYLKEVEKQLKKIQANRNRISKA